MTALTNDQKAEDLRALANLYRIQSLLGRIQKNIQLAVTAPNSKTVTVLNPNLYRLAAQYYGDATQWTVIAKANNLVDPYQSGFLTLIIPNDSGVKSNGIYEP